MISYNKINKKIYQISTLIIVLVFAINTIYAFSDSLSSLISKTEKPYVLYLPKYSEIDWLTIIYDKNVEKKRVSSKIYKSYNQENENFTEKSISELGEFMTICDENLRILKYSGILKESDIIEQTGYDTLLITLDQSRKELLSQAFVDSKMKTEKKIVYDQFSITTLNINIFLQGLIATGFNRSFNADFIVVDQATKVNMDFIYFYGKNIQSLMPQYQLPEDMLKLFISQNSEYIVYTLELTGIAKIFYPYKTFLIYMSRYPYEIYGVISGPPESASYGFQNIMKIK